MHPRLDEALAALPDCAGQEAAGAACNRRQILGLVDRLGALITDAKDLTAANPG